MNEDLLQKIYERQETILKRLDDIEMQIRVTKDFTKHGAPQGRELSRFDFF